MAEPQSRPETAPDQALVVVELPSQDAVAAEASGADEAKAIVVLAPASEFCVARVHVNEMVFKGENSRDTEIPENKPSSRGSIDRDIALAQVAKEKQMSYVKAWEESEKAKADNRGSCLGRKKEAALEAELKKLEEKLEKKKAKCVEKMKNKMALVHKKAEEKRAVIESKRGEEVLKAEESAAKYRATGTTPKKSMGCCGMA
ncbi:unnamed protein product [Sphenostylis stenocarpa]|uniref:Remorin C-terminal domain-containing protein n=1 Tax=Sphenostylis stenocarpa TaxID=92480 RepID=A0AA86S0K2_9FABA|nr:unnamed protein product [Sphenostylis stenocarpa]CAJ1817528.1 unnamed protein product [Sphenostylis stenocarpa]